MSLLLALACGPSTPQEARSVAQLKELDLSGVEELALVDRGFGPELATALVEGAPGLIRLDLSGNLLGTTGGAALAGLASLEVLDLGPGRVYVEGNRIGTKGARALLSAPDGALVDLDLSRNGVEGEAFRALTHPLQTLVVDSNSIGDEGCASIAGISTLKKLHMGWAGVGDACAVALGAHQGLEELLLSSNDIGDAGVEALAKMPSLRVLYLSNNAVTDGAPLRHLERLNLDGNPLADREALKRDFEGDWLSAEPL